MLSTALGLIQCKIYHIVKIRTKGWVICEKPRFTKEYCLPFKPNNPKLEQEPFMMDIFQESKESFETIVKCRKVRLPLHLVFEAEKGMHPLENEISNPKVVKENVEALPEVDDAGEISE